MKLRTTLSVIVGCVAMSMFVTFITLKAQSKPTIRIQQLKNANGETPVEIKAPRAAFDARNMVTDIGLIVRNNSDKGIAGFSVKISVLLERNGTVNHDTSFHTVTAAVHRDFYDLSSSAKAIIPGQEVPVNNSSTTTYDPETKVIGVEISIDYVEFVDDSSLGPNERGKESVSKIRKGADRYRELLIQKYLSNGKMISAILPILRSNEMPSELGFTTTTQELRGATTYRKNLLRMYDKDGEKELDQFIKKHWY